MDFVLVMVSVASAGEAETISGSLVTERLAASVQVVGPVRETARRDRAVTTVERWVCLAKTTSDRCPALERRLAEIHSDTEPEVSIVPITAGSKGYLDWITAETRV